MVRASTILSITGLDHIAGQPDSPLQGGLSRNGAELRRQTRRWSESHLAWRDWQSALTSRRDSATVISNPARRSEGPESRSQSRPCGLVRRCRDPTNGTRVNGFSHAPESRRFPRAADKTAAGPWAPWSRDACRPRSAGHESAPRLELADRGMWAASASLDTLVLPNGSRGDIMTAWSRNSA